jgi:hypothetical protein
MIDEFESYFLIETVSKHLPGATEGNHEELE